MKFKTLKTILSHPLTAGTPVQTLFRFFKRGIVIRLHRHPVVYPFIGGTHLVVEKGMSSAELQIYTGLYDFCETAFLIHYLQKDEDLFVDVGANIGVYSVLTAGVSQVPTIAAEPAPQAFERLKRNIRYNQLDALVELENVAIGDQNGFLYFTSELDAVNHVVPEGSRESALKVPSITLDELLVGKNPTCLKIDVEGFEANVINGATAVLSAEALQVVIMETNGLSDQYDYGQGYLHQKLLSFGFSPCRYEPVSRKLIRLDGPLDTNTLYVKDVEAAQKRTAVGPRFSVGHHSF